MQETRIDIWDFFTEKVLKGQSSDDTTVLWRGQRNPTWPLASSFERRVLVGWNLDGPQALPPYDGHPSEPEKEDIARRRTRLKTLFSRALLGVAGAPPDRPDERRLWALGRHFGLITPYLDWTRNPYFAAFFALSGSWPDGSQDVAVYRLTYDQHLRDAGLRLHEDIWLPELQRMHRQHGVFTEIDDGDRTFEVEGACIKAERPQALRRFIIDKKIAKEAMADLRAHGLDYHIVYPDLEGAALYANSQVFGG
jgi:hypothetical protein